MNTNSIDTSKVTYIGAFLTFACQYNCPYCVNRYGEYKPRKAMKWEYWADGLSRLQTREDLPITLQGGEPTLLLGFSSLVRTLWILDKKMDILTNFQVDYKDWYKRIPIGAFRRASPYPSIRVSYHPGQSSILGLLQRVYRATRDGYSVGIWAVDHPAYSYRIRQLQKVAKAIGIEFRKKEFLGWHDGAFYGEYAYSKAVGQKGTRTVECKSNEILIAPDGYLHRCHADLYAGRNSIGHILDKYIPSIGQWRRCEEFGHCNACDCKLKTDRNQVGGFCAVQVRDTTDPTI